MENNDPDAVLGAGQKCPALGDFPGKPEVGDAVGENGDGASRDEVTAGEWSVIHQILQRLGAPDARAGRGSALARGALKFMAMLVLATGVGFGLGDGDEFDDVGCTVAQQPDKSSHGGHSAECGEPAGGKRPGSGGGAAGGADGDGAGDRPECEVRAERCPNRMADGRCQRSQKQCLLFVSAVEVREMLAGVHREVAAVRGVVVELRSAKERLEKMLADGLFAFTQKVDPGSFKVLCTVLAEGDIAKASRSLATPEATIRAVVQRWEGRGKEYRAMLELVRWRKKIGRKEKLPLNDAIVHERAQTVDFPGLLADVLDGLLSMTEENRAGRCEELAELLRPVVANSGT